MGARTILHIDFDSFFASVAQQDTPSLRNKPIGITATNGRTCIIAASREAKQYGVKSPSRTFDAQRMCPDIQFLPANFDRYWEVSKQFLLICKDYSPYIEIFSIDEVFMDVTQSAHLFGGVDALIVRLKKRLVKEVGAYITVSVGISHNKLLAKLASGMNKPNGKGAITQENLDTIYTQAKLTDICGIGGRIKQRLSMLGISTLLQLRFVPMPSLIAEFGPAEARFLYNAARGIDTTPLVLYTQVPGVKSVGRTYCLPENEYNMRVVLQNLYELCEEVSIKLRRLNKRARTVEFLLYGTHSIHGRYTATVGTHIGKELFLPCLSEVKKTVPYWEDDNYIRQIKVWVSNLEENTSTPLSLFEDYGKKERVWQIVDAINKKFGNHTIRNGFLLYADKLTTKPNGWMADTYERTKLVQENAY